MEKLRKAHFVIWILFLAGIHLGPADAGESANPVMMQVFALGLLLYFSIIYRETLFRHARLLWGPMPLTLLAIVSAAWSLDPGWSFRRGLVFSAATFLAYYVGATYSPRRLIALYRLALLIIIGASLAIVALLPGFGRDGGDWIGCMYHKNRLGETMVLAFISFVIAPTETLPRIFRWLVPAAALLLLYKSHAGGATGNVAIVLAAQVVWLILQQRRKIIAAIVLTGYPLVAIAVLLIRENAGLLFKLLGKDPTFTGRTPIWRGVIAAIRLRPLLGYGYLAFWHQKGGTPIYVAELTAWPAPHAHEGYLDLMINLGIVGLLIFLAFFVRSMWLAIAEGRRTGGKEAQWFFSFIILVAVTSFTESQIVTSLFLWTTLTALSISFAVQRAGRYDEAAMEEELHAEQGELVQVA